MNEIVPTHNIGGYVPMVDGPEKVAGRAKVHRRSRRSRHAGGAHLPQSLFPRRDHRGRRLRRLAGPRREGDRHRRRLRQDVRRAADRAQRASHGARQGALPRRAGGGGRGRRRRHRQACHRSDQAQGARAAGLLHLAGGDGRGRQHHPCAQAEQYRARRAVRARQRGARPAGGRSRARRPLRLRRGLSEPDGDACRGRRVRRGARTHDRPRQHPGPLLRAPDAGADPRHGHVEDPGDQAACRRRLRLPHRSAQCRAHRRASCAQGCGQCAHGDHPRGDLHHPSRPAADRHPAQARHAQGRQDHRGGVRMLPARRRPFRLRRGDHPLCRLDAVRDLRPAQRQIYRQARAHQYAALRRVPRPRHRRRPLRIREPARRDGGRARARPAGGAARELPDGAHLHRQRPDGEQLRPAGMRGLGREGERLERAQGQACRRARGWALPARITSAAPRGRSTGPASRMRP